MSLKLVRFLLAGVPAFGIAIATNWMLGGVLAWPKPLAYALTLLIQMTVNFFACRWFVFDTDPSKRIWPQYVQFVSGLAVFRLADWIVYTALVEAAGVHYLAAQITNVVLFSVLRLKFLERLFESPKDAAE
jgi:putative flippase GtrA